MISDIILIVLVVLFMLSLVRDNRNLRLEIQKKTIENSKILSQKKSSEVRLGFLSEHLAPLLKVFPYDIQDPDVVLVPLGNPIDYFVVTDDEIGLIEIKTGGARLNKRQTHIRNLLQKTR